MVVDGPPLNPQEEVVCQENGLAIEAPETSEKIINVETKLWWMGRVIGL